MLGNSHQLIETRSPNEVGRVVPFLVGEVRTRSSNSDGPSRLFSGWLARPASAGMIFWFVAIVIAGYGLATGAISKKALLEAYAIDVAVILLCIEIFTSALIQTGLLEKMSLTIALRSGGGLVSLLVMSSCMLFVVSGLLNNLAAAMVTVPILLRLMRVMQINQRYLSILMGLLLPVINLGGAATPMGDFPAVIIFTSGLSTFNGYLYHALPLFMSTMIVLIVVAVFFVRRLPNRSDKGVVAERRALAIALTRAETENVRVEWGGATLLCGIFAAMWAGWALMDNVPPMFIALAGALATLIVAGGRFRDQLVASYDLSPFFSITGVLAIAAAVQASGVLNLLTHFLLVNIADPASLLIVVMMVVTIASGLLSAGPAAAATLPLVAILVEGPLNSHRDWVITGFAAAICAGSSLFLWSATSGLKLWAMTKEADLADDSDLPLKWGPLSYLPNGLHAAVLQLTIAIVWVWVALHPGVAILSVALVVIGGTAFSIAFLAVYWTREAIEPTTKIRASHYGIVLNLVGIVLSILGIWLQIRG